MDERGQATVEYLGISVLLLALLLGAGAVAAHAARRTAPPGDAAYLRLAARYTPRVAIERGADGGELPVDFRRCRRPDCARGTGVRPVLFLHAVRANGNLYLEYWEYVPDSRLAHTGIPAVDGFHDDDWEGLIVKLRGDGTVIGARATAHLGFNGRHPWWTGPHRLGSLPGRPLPRLGQPRRVLLSVGDRRRRRSLERHPDVSPAPPAGGRRSGTRPTRIRVRRGRAVAEGGLDRPRDALHRPPR